MTPNEYQELAGRTLLTYPPRLDGLEIMLLWNAMGVAGEAGEVAELAKKQIFHKQGIDPEKWKKELGDVLWYVAACCSKLGLSLEDVMQHNIDKLIARYPEGFDYERTKFRDGVAG